MPQHTCERGSSQGRHNCQICASEVLFCPGSSFPPSNEQNDCAEYAQIDLQNEVNARHVQIYLSLPRLQSSRVPDGVSAEQQRQPQPYSELGPPPANTQYPMELDLLPQQSTRGSGQHQVDDTGLGETRTKETGYGPFADHQIPLSERSAGPHTAILIRTHTPYEVTKQWPPSTDENGRSSNTRRATSSAEVEAFLQEHNQPHRQRDRREDHCANTNLIPRACTAPSLRRTSDTARSDDVENSEDDQEERSVSD